MPSILEKKAFLMNSNEREWCNTFEVKKTVQNNRCVLLKLYFFAVFHHISHQQKEQTLAEIYVEARNETIRCIYYTKMENNSKD